VVASFGISGICSHTQDVSLSKGQGAAARMQAHHLPHGRSGGGKAALDGTEAMQLSCVQLIHT
jgi:hypothetical protein